MSDEDDRPDLGSPSRNQGPHLFLLTETIDSVPIEHAEAVDPVVRRASTPVFLACAISRTAGTVSRRARDPYLSACSTKLPFTRPITVAGVLDGCEVLVRGSPGNG